MSSFVPNQTSTAAPVKSTSTLAKAKAKAPAKKVTPALAAKKPAVRKTVQQTLDASYKTAKMLAAKLVSNVDNNAKLEMYKWFKQAENSDCTGKRPGMFNVKARAKYDAWASCKGTPKPLAMQKYVETVCALSQK